MDGRLAQTVALAAHARVFSIHPSSAGDASYWSRHSTFKPVRVLRFVTRRWSFFGSREEEVATSPPDWMRTIPQGTEVQFIGGGIGVSTRNSCHAWDPKWEAIGDGTSGQAGWNVTYARKRALFILRPGDAEKAKDRLAAALRDAAGAVGGDARPSASAEEFRNAAAALNAGDPVAPHYPDILPARGYGLACRQLMAASVAGFAGMEAWTAGPASQTEQPAFQALYKELFIAALEGLATAVNAKIDP